jgi:hypothetical protein
MSKKLERDLDPDSGWNSNNGNRWGPKNSDNSSNQEAITAGGGGGGGGGGGVPVNLNDNTSSNSNIKGAWRFGPNVVLSKKIGTPAYNSEPDEITRVTDDRIIKRITLNNRRHKHILYLKSLQEEKRDEPETVRRLQDIIDEIPTKGDLDLQPIYFGRGTGIWDGENKINSSSHLENANKVKLIIKSPRWPEGIKVVSYAEHVNHRPSHPHGSMDARDELPWSSHGVDWRIAPPPGIGFHKLPNAQRRFLLNSAKREFSEETGVDIDKFFRDNRISDENNRQYNVKITGTLTKCTYEFLFEITDEQYSRLRTMIIESNSSDHETAAIYAQKYQKYKQKYLELKNKNKI